VEPVAHVFGPGTPAERCVMVRPLVVEGVKEEQFQVLLGIDVLHAVGACLDMSACRLTYQANRPGLQGHCAFTMCVPASLLLTSAAPEPPLLASSALPALDELYPLVPLEPPGLASLYVLTAAEADELGLASSGDGDLEDEPPAREELAQLDVISPLAPPPAALPLVPTELHFLAAPPPPLLPAPGRRTPRIPDLDPPATAPPTAWQPPFRRLGAPSGQASETRVPGHSAGGGPRPPRPPPTSSPHGWRCRQRSWRPSSGGWG
jgi:hypothetical protein